MGGLFLITSLHLSSCSDHSCLWPLFQSPIRITWHPENLGFVPCLTNVSKTTEWRKQKRGLILKSRCCPMTAAEDTVYSRGLSLAENSWTIKTASVCTDPSQSPLPFYAYPSISLFGEFVPIRGSYAWGWIRITGGHVKNTYPMALFFRNFI